MKIEDAMELWATWHDNSGISDVPIWYPGKSVGFATGGISCFDDMEISDDSRICGEIDAAVNALPPAQHAAIHHKYLEAVFRFPRGNYELLLEFAFNEIIRIIRDKGIVISEE